MAKQANAVKNTENQLDSSSSTNATEQGEHIELTSQDADEVKLEIMGSRQLSSWLAEERVSLAFTTYQAGKLFFIGLQPDGRLSVHERTFNRCMGLWGNDQTVLMSTLYQLWRFENALEPGQIHQGYDRLYVPQVAYTTGDIDIHDLHMDKHGKPVFISTLFSCVATVSDTHSFMPIWKPKFISRLAAEDRCHLNGLAMVDGEPRYVSAVSQTDVNEGWREHRKNGGVVIDMSNDEIVCEGLSMPHSTRWHNGKLWLVNSGTGEFGFVDMNKGKFEPVAFCPGYARGLSFINNYAVVGLSKCRQNRTFRGLELDDRLKDKNVDARCSVQIIDLNTGDIVHSLTIEGIIEELYDVITIPNVIRPMALGFKTDEIRRTLTIGE